MVYYNEIDPVAANWLRYLIAMGLIAPGEIDERSIEDVRPNELRGFAQCHFFAGIGVWSYALRQTRWPDNRPVWTGSCPCQPFSAAGKGAGFDDERHLWPAWHWLIAECRPAIIFGEQVASKAVKPWIDLVHADLEALGYAFGCIPFPSAGVGAPHIRDRAYWVADTSSIRYVSSERSRSDAGSSPETHGKVRHKRIRDESISSRDRASAVADGTGPTNGFWRDTDWLFCRDDKWRPVEPGAFPLVNGASARMGRLRGYGNAINAKAAKAFIESYLDVVSVSPNRN